MTARRADEPAAGPAHTEPVDPTLPGEAAETDQGADPAEVLDAPVAAVLGPAPTWAAALVASALAGEALAVATDRAAQVAGLGFLVAGGLLGWLLARTVGVLRRAVDRAAWHGPGAVGLGALALVTVAAVGLATASVRVATTDRGLLPALAAAGGSRSVTATVVHEPRPTAVGWHVVLRVDELGGVPTRERAATVIEAPPPALGQRLVGQASARPLPAGGYGRWIARQHATVVLDAPTWTTVGQPGHVFRASEHVRGRIRVSAAARQPDRVGGLLAGFVTGDTRGLPEPDVEAMRATGLSHLTAVSGTHVAVLVAGVLGLGVLLRIGARGRRGLLFAVLVSFAFLTRFEPSVLRAGTMGLVVLLAGARGVPRDARHGLSVAVLLLVLVDPLLAGSLGLLLSATAAAGVLVLAPVVRDRVTRLPRRLAEVLAVTIGAQLAVVPLLLGAFGEVPLASVPANVVAVPAAVVAVGGAFAAGLVSLVVPEVGAWLFALAGLPARVVLWSAHAFDDVGAVASTARPATVVALAAGAGWLLVDPRRRRWRVALLSLALAAVLLAWVPALTGGRPPTVFTVTAIDVGQGDAFLLESPQVRVLVDAGEGETAARWLRANGRRHLDLLVITHGHLDHIGGAATVLRTVPVGAVWYRPFPTDLPEARDLLVTAAELGVPVRAPTRGDRATIGDLDLEVLSPGPGRPYRWSRSELNDSSLVLRVGWHDRRVLVTGDVEAPAQTDLLALPAAWGRPDLLHAELLLVPHHGSTTSLPAFLGAIRPRVGLISAGVDNRHGHPHPDVLAVLDGLGAEVRRTDLEGSVRVEVPAPDGSRAPVGSGHAARAPPRR